MIIKDRAVLWHGLLALALLAFIAVNLVVCVYSSMYSSLMARASLVSPAWPLPAAPASSLFADMTETAGIEHTYRNGEEAGQATLLEGLGGGAALIDYDKDGLLDIVFTSGGQIDQKQQVSGHPLKIYKNLGNWQFRDVTAEVGLDQPVFYTHGCAVADYDRDGWPDLLITGWGRVVLYHNEPDGKGGRRFVDMTEKAGLTGVTWGTSAAFADLDGDGFPDLYICQYADRSSEAFYSSRKPGERGPAEVSPPLLFRALPHKLFHNQGDGTFKDVSKEAGLRVPRAEQDYDQLFWLDKDARDRLRDADKPQKQDYGKGLGVVIVDVNGDGKPDIYVANDTTDNFLYLNRSEKGHIRLEEVGVAAGVARGPHGQALASHGLAVGDPLNTGRPALFVAAAETEHLLYLNECVGAKEQFRGLGQVAGTLSYGQLGAGWGTGFLDLDHNGWQDLAVSGGHRLLTPLGGGTREQPPLLLHNRGTLMGLKQPYEDITRQGGAYFQTVHRGRGVAFGDLDNDGQTDLVLCHLNEPAVLLKNEAPAQGRRWIGVELVGKDHRDVVGAKVQVDVDDLRLHLTRFTTGGGSYASASDPRHVFGLGEFEGEQVTVTVSWPLGETQSWDGLTVGHYWKLAEGNKDAR
jgi:hypothetical protein